MKIADDQKRANTDALFEYFTESHTRAAAEPKDFLRDIALATARDAEWYTLWAIVKIGAISDLYEMSRIFDRIQVRADEMKLPPA